MKIAIVGAGVAGLCTYLNLRKHLPKDTRITIFESHRPRADPSAAAPSADAITFASLSASTQLVGGAVGIAPNGMRALRALDEALHADVVREGFVVRRAVFRAARGWRLASLPWGDRRAPEEWLVALARQRLWAALLRRVGEGAVRYAKVTGVEVGEGKGVVVRVEGGAADEEFDLVVGADGVKSVVRRDVFGDKYPAAYEYVEASAFPILLRVRVLTDSAEVCSVSEASSRARSRRLFGKRDRWYSPSVQMASSVTVPAVTKKPCGGRRTKHQYRKS